MHRRQRPRRPSVEGPPSAEMVNAAENAADSPHDHVRGPALLVLGRAAVGLSLPPSWSNQG